MGEGLDSKYGSREEIRRGRFGVAYRCSSAVSGDASAYKAIDKRLLADATDRDYIDKEPKIPHLQGFLGQKLPPHGYRSLRLCRSLRPPHHFRPSVLRS
ncbi:Phosphoenolpyruvate carboxylase kinase 4 [Sarracenia purpurea var. burkii]